MTCRGRAVLKIAAKFCDALESTVCVQALIISQTAAEKIPDIVFACTGEMKATVQGQKKPKHSLVLSSV